MNWIVRSIREPVTVILSRMGWIRALRGHLPLDGEIKFKDGDGPGLALHLLLLTLRPLPLLWSLRRARPGALRRVSGADPDGPGPGGAQDHTSSSNDHPGMALAA